MRIIERRHVISCALVRPILHNSKMEDQTYIMIKVR